MIEKAQSVLMQLPDIDKTILMVHFGQEVDMSEEAKRLKTILESLTEEERNLVLNMEYTDGTDTSTTEMGWIETSEDVSFES